MAIKESSDELNPAVTTAGGPVGLPLPARSLKDYLALAVATCGVGYLPLAPGTFGSLVGLGFYVLLRGALLRFLYRAGASERWDPLQIAYLLVTLELLAIFAITIVGTWAASRTEQLSGKKDPSKVVIDEVAGQVVALTSIPMDFGSWWMVILAFGLFRFFDIVKPYPARRLESLHGGLGIMADDLVAGVYAALGVALVVSLRWFL